MKLFYSPGACSLSPHIVINELGIEAEFIRVNLATHKLDDGKDFLHINPFGSVPFLALDDGNVLSEGPAIVQYLADLKPEAGIAPLNATFERYLTQQWLNYLSTEIHKGYLPVFYASQSDAYGHKAKLKMMDSFRKVDKQLGKHDFLTGNHFTVADAYLFALVGWSKAEWITSYIQSGIVLDGFENIRRWYTIVSKRPAVIRSLAEEGL